MQSIHSKLADYRPTGRHFNTQVKTTIGIGVVATGMNLLFIALLPESTGPLYWFLGGTCLGILFIFLGGYGLRRKNREFGFLGEKLQPTFSNWFPLLHFWFRYLFLCFVFAAIWFQIIREGMPTSLAHQISILLLMIYSPFRRLINEKAVHMDNRRWELIDEWAGFFMGIFLFSCVGLTLSQFVMPAREVSGGQPDQAPIFMTVGVWVTVSIIILSQLVLLIDKLSRKNKR